jgi:hypothetical protein
MAGKKRRKSPTVKDNRGGARKGTGPKPRRPAEYNLEIKNKYIIAAEKLQKEFGYGIEEAILRLIYSENVQDTVKVAIAKLWSQIFIIKESKQEIKHEEFIDGSWGLPEPMQDPAKEIFSKKEQEENKVIKLDENK